MAISTPSVRHESPFVSTGHLPSPETIKALIDEVYTRFATVADGRNSSVYPALMRVERNLFGICVVGTRGDVYAAGDSQYDFTIMSVSKPFIFALRDRASGLVLMAGYVGSLAGSDAVAEN